MHNRDHYVVSFAAFQTNVTGFEVKVGQIGPKWDKSWTFTDQVSVHFGSVSQNKLKFDV